MLLKYTFLNKNQYHLCLNGKIDTKPIINLIGFCSIPQKYNLSDCEEEQHIIIIEFESIEQVNYSHQVIICGYCHRNENFLPFHVSSV